LEFLHYVRIREKTAARQGKEPKKCNIRGGWREGGKKKKKGIIPKGKTPKNGAISQGFAVRNVEESKYLEKRRGRKRGGV